MAVRLINLHAHPLRIDLRGGGVLLLAAGQRSPALREELLYDNTHLSEWERAGWLRRLPARMSEVGAAAAAPAAPAVAARKRAAAPVKAAVRKTAPPVKAAGKAAGKKASTKRR